MNANAGVTKLRRHEMSGGQKQGKSGPSLAGVLGDCDLVELADAVSAELERRVQAGQLVRELAQTFGNPDPAGFLAAIERELARRRRA